MQEISRFSKQDYISESLQVSASEKVVYGVHETHWHDFYEMEYFLSGSGVYVVNGLSYEIRKGALFFMSPTDFHSFRINNAEGARIINIMCTEQHLHEELVFSLLHHSENVVVEFKQGDIAAVLQICRLIVQQKDSSALFHDDYIESLLNCLMIMILRKIGDGKSENTDPCLTPVLKALHYIQLHFRNQLHLAEVAYQVGLSKNYLSRMFHEFVGMTYKEYLLKLRLDYARKLLLYTDAPVNEICMAAGFQTLEHFLRTFKVKYGTTPKKFRRLQ